MGRKSKEKKNFFFKRKGVAVGRKSKKIKNFLKESDKVRKIKRKQNQNMEGEEKKLWAEIKKGGI